MRLRAVVVAVRRRGVERTLRGLADGAPRRGAACVEGAAFSVRQRHSITASRSAPASRASVAASTARAGRPPVAIVTAWPWRASLARRRCAVRGAKPRAVRSRAVRSIAGGSLRSRAHRAPRCGGPVGEGDDDRGAWRGTRDEGAPVAGQRDRSGVKGTHGPRRASTSSRRSSRGARPTRDGCCLAAPFARHGLRARGSRFAAACQGPG